MSTPAYITPTPREMLIEDLGELGVGAGALRALPDLSIPPRTAESDRAEADAMQVLRPLLREISARRYLF
ncbi:hypothetical protein HDG32_005342 [Paraburkholderia sp. CI2]|uniref:hypothetical protein n=1 Tax=Paraburkholderia sp. CI2 TaxID=2723093 RepID=UPI001618A9EB|nr:hypothetical protein [Paraburkholderia sp. CI2]MBB5469195.1 hypothetical protein [Paraburkholderia sp. CI2]